MRINATAVLPLFRFVIFGATFLHCVYVTVHLYTAHFGGFCVPSFSTAIPIRFNGILYYSIYYYKVFDSLDISQFNVIDVYSYGISFDIYKKILTNKNVRKGTVVIYTAITNEFTKIQNEAKNEFGFRSFYNKAPSLFNARAIEFFYELLAQYGVSEVFYYEVKDNFIKHYGYFRTNK